MDWDQERLGAEKLSFILHLFQFLGVIVQVGNQALQLTKSLNFGEFLDFSVSVF